MSKWLDSQTRAASSSRGRGGEEGRKTGSYRNYGGVSVFLEKRASATHDKGNTLNQRGCVCNNTEGD